MSLNEQFVGTTPYEDDFLWYGWYRVTLAKPGYQTLYDRVLIKAPVSFWIPFDLLMELLPVPIRDTRVLSYRLAPQTPLPEPTPPRTDGEEVSDPAVSTTPGSE